MLGEIVSKPSIPKRARQSQTAGGYHDCEVYLCRKETVSRPIIAVISTNSSLSQLSQFILGAKDP
jgi:hypothetical protein